LLSIDKSFIDKDSLVRLVENIRLEYLVHQTDLIESVEQVGEEIKENWWSKNKARYINPQE
jgi:hypothetical protein